MTTLIPLKYGGEIAVTNDDGEVSIKSKVLYIENVMNEADVAHNARVSGFESLLMALMQAGFDLTTPQMRQAVQSAVDEIWNDL